MEDVLRRRRSAESQVVEMEAESLSESLPEGFPSEGEKGLPRYPVVTSHLNIWVNIAHGSIWGVLVRKGLTNLTTYNGSYLSGVVWANFTACVVMGMAVESSHIWAKLVSSSMPNKGTLPFYVGLTTGFCGTCSSFSSAILEAFNRSADTVPGVYYNYPNAAYGIMEALAVFITQFGISSCGFYIGKNIIEAQELKFPQLTTKSYKVLEITSLVCGFSAYIIAIVLVAVQHQGPWRLWMFSIIFAPFGAWGRYYLSKYLNTRVKNFPMGTFCANTTGCLLLAIFTLLGRGKRSSSSTVPVTNTAIGCHVLVGLDDGFCGALTTVSTFVTELSGLQTTHAYKYAVTSILVGYAIMIILLGSYNWSVGLTDPICT